MSAKTETHLNGFLLGQNAPQTNEKNITQSLNRIGKYESLEMYAKNAYLNIHSWMDECIRIRWCGDIPIIPQGTAAQNANGKKEKCNFSEKPGKPGKHHLFHKPIKWTLSVARYIGSVCLPTGCRGTNLVMHDSCDIAHREVSLSQTVNRHQNIKPWGLLPHN